MTGGSTVRCPLHWMRCPLHWMLWVLTGFFLLFMAGQAHQAILSPPPGEPTPGEPFRQKGLREEIERLAARVEQPAENARLDPVWKAIPGYNGLALDREMTCQVALRRPGGPLFAVLRETEPAVQLEQLMPAPIYRGNLHKPMVGFLINVAWGEEHLPSMLAVLQEEGVKATFFFDGSWAEDHPQWVRRIALLGHEIGNHAYSHPMMSRLSEREMEEQIGKTNEVLEGILGERPRYFAPPAGDYNQKVVEVAHRLNMWTILWTLDTVDWKNPPAEWILQRIVPAVDNGHLILMHPTASTVQALKPLIRHIRAKQLQLGTVSDVLSSRRTDVVRLPEF